MRLAALAALTLSSLCAEPYPDGAALVKPSESALRRLPGYVFDDRSVNNTLMLGKTFTTRNDIHMAKASPGKAHVEVKNEDDRLPNIRPHRSYRQSRCLPDGIRRRRKSALHPSAVG